MKTQLVVGVVAIGLLGCGEDGLSPREGCEKVVVALCSQVYACLTADEIAQAQFPATERACVTAEQESNECASQTEETTCGPVEKYQADEAADCANQIADLSCNQFRDPAVLLNLEVAAPACGRICVAE